MEMHFATVWETFADTIGDATAIVHGPTRRTWAEYDERAARVAAAYVDAGLRPGSKVGLLMYNCNEYLEAQYGVLKMRGVPINVNYRYLDEELVYLLDNSTPKPGVPLFAGRASGADPRPPARHEAPDRGRRRRLRGGAGGR
jgi:fatty-acyl-CoA synthase